VSGVSEVTGAGSLTHNELIGQLAAVVGNDHVLQGAEAMAPHLTDWRGRYHGAARCLVRPASTAEVAGVVRVCAAAGVPMVPQGGNTSLCGGGIPDLSGNAVMINLSRLNSIRAIDRANNTITVEAGCLLKTVQDAAFEAGRYFPLSLAAEGSCQIGGNLSTNAGGVRVLRYGNIREFTMGLETVLPNGEVWDGLRGLRKDNTGYDLKQLFIGAEGTLGIITAAVLKLFPQPRATATAWLAIESPSVAVQLLGELQSGFGTSLTACELVSELSLNLVFKHIEGAQPPLSTSPWYLLVELSAPDGEGELNAGLERFLETAFENGTVSDAVIAQSIEQTHKLWALRENISEAEKKEGIAIKHDISLPISRLAEFLDAADVALSAAFPGVRIVAFGHVGDGNLHYNQSMPDKEANAAFIPRQPEVNRVVYDLVTRFGGSISAEHGIGQLKRRELAFYRSAVEIDMMRAIKQALDPNGIMNPGKVL